MTFRKSAFVIEDWFGPFEGWTEDQNCNGWACPYFEPEIAMQMVDAWGRVTFGNKLFKAHYNEERNQFCFWSSGSDWDCFGPQTINVEGRQITVYPIGAGAWIWEEAE